MLYWLLWCFISILLDIFTTPKGAQNEKAFEMVARLVFNQELLADRETGTAVGEIVISSDFNKPLPEEILRGFEE